MAPKLVEPGAVEGAGDHHARAGRDGVHGRDGARQVEGDVDLVEHDHRGHPGVHREDQVAFDAAEVQVVVQAGHEEGHVHVGGQHLRLSIGGVAAQEGAPPGQHLAQGGLARVLREWLQRQPVTHRRQCRAIGGFTREAPLDDDLRHAGPGDSEAAGAAHHAARDKAGSCLRAKGHGAVRRPAQLAEGGRRDGRIEAAHQPTRFSLPVRLA